MRTRRGVSTHEIIKPIQTATVYLLFAFCRRDNATREIFSKLRNVFFGELSSDISSLDVGVINLRVFTDGSFFVDRERDLRGELNIRRGGKIRVGTK